MPKPTTLHDLLALLRRSRLVAESHLDRLQDRAAGTDTPSPIEILAQMVTDGLLTRFQATQLAAGRWRGFAIGQYRLLDKLGAGGMGSVYLAEPVEPGPRVAVKVLDRRLINDSIARERFTREAWAAAALAHPNIIHVLAVYTDDESPHLVMEYVDGVSLQAAVARAGTFTPGTVAEIGRQVATGLDRACEVGLVHRDIKPANLLFTASGTVKILDLGIVRVPWSGALTQRFDARTVLGTADYLAPEQAVDSSAVDSRADIYALGSTLYFLLAGHPPYPDGSPEDKLLWKQSVDPLPITQLRPDVPAELAAVIETMMARNPADRYARPADAAAALRPFAKLEVEFPDRLMAASRPTLSDVNDSPTPVDYDRFCPSEGPSTDEVVLMAAPTDRLPAVLPSAWTDEESVLVGGAEIASSAKTDFVDFQAAPTQKTPKRPV